MFCNWFRQSLICCATGKMEVKLEKQFDNVEKLRKIQQKLVELLELDSGEDVSFTAKLQNMMEDVRIRILEIDRAVEHDYSEADKLQYTQAYVEQPMSATGTTTTDASHCQNYFNFELF